MYIYMKIFRSNIIPIFIIVLAILLHSIRVLRVINVFLDVFYNMIRVAPFVTNRHYYHLIITV